MGFPAPDLEMRYFNFSSLTKNYMSTAHTLEEASVEIGKTPLSKASMDKWALGAAASRDL